MFSGPRRGIKGLPVGDGSGVGGAVREDQRGVAEVRCAGGREEAVVAQWFGCMD